MRVDGLYLFSLQLLPLYIVRVVVRNWWERRAVRTVKETVLIRFP